MSILFSSKTGKYLEIEKYCKENFNTRTSFTWKICKDDKDYKIILTPNMKGNLIILNGKTLPCKVDFENKPTLLCTFFDDDKLSLLPKWVEFFVKTISFSNCVFSEKKLKFIMNHYEDIKYSILEFCKDKKTAKKFVEEEPFCSIFTQNNVKITVNSKLSTK